MVQDILVGVRSDLSDVERCGKHEKANLIYKMDVFSIYTCLQHPGGHDSFLVCKFLGNLSIYPTTKDLPHQVGLYRFSSSSRLPRSQNPNSQSHSSMPFDSAYNVILCSQRLRIHTHVCLFIRVCSQMHRIVRCMMPQTFLRPILDRERRTVGSRTNWK